MDSFIMHSQLDYVVFLKATAYLFLTVTCYVMSQKKAFGIKWFWLSLAAALAWFAAWMELLGISLGENTIFKFLNMLFRILACISLLEMVRQTVNALKLLKKRLHAAWYLFYGLLISLSFVKQYPELGYIPQIILPVSSCFGVAVVMFLVLKKRERFIGQGWVVGVIMLLYALVQLADAGHGTFFLAQWLNQDNLEKTIYIPIQLAEGLLILALEIVIWRLSWLYPADSETDAPDILPVGYRHLVVPMVVLIFFGAGSGVNYFGRNQERVLQQALIFKLNAVAAALPWEEIKTWNSQLPVLQQKLEKFGRELKLPAVYIEAWRQGQRIILASYTQTPEMDLNQTARRGRVELERIFQQPQAVVLESSSGQRPVWILGLKPCSLKLVQPGMVCLGIREDAANWEKQVRFQRMIPILTFGVFSFFLIGFVFSYRWTLENRQLIVLAETRFLSAQAKNIFLTNMSHELRTPLNAILGFTQLLYKNPEIGPEQRKQLGMILRAGDHLLAIINDILEIAKIEAGHAVLNSKVFDLSLMIADLRQMFNFRAEAKGLKLLVEIREPMPMRISADANKLRQIFMNLLGNAIKFTQRGEVKWRVEITRSSDARLWLYSEVKDTGVGIRAKDINRVFVSFEQAESGMKSGGTGLGLAISRSYAQLMQGDITVASEYGRGSCFMLTAAIEPAPVSQLSPAEPPQTIRGLKIGAGACRILLLSEDEILAAIITGMLIPFGFEVNQVGCQGEEPSRVFQAWLPHLILLDLRTLACRNGSVNQIKAWEKDCRIPVIIFGEGTAADNRLLAKVENADGIIAMPIQEAELLEKIKDCLGFEYEKCSEPARDGEPLLPDLAITEVLGTMPEIVLELEAALQRVDYTRIHENIDRIALRQPEAARQLREIAERFEYQHLRALLPRRRPHAG